MLVPISEQSTAISTFSWNAYTFLNFFFFSILGGKNPLPTVALDRGCVRVWRIHVQRCMCAYICQKKCMRKRRCACMLQKMLAAQQKKNIILLILIIWLSQSNIHGSHHDAKPSATERPKRRRRLPRSRKSTARRIANCDDHDEYTFVVAAVSIIIETKHVHELVQQVHFPFFFFYYECRRPPDPFESLSTILLG